MFLLFFVGGQSFNLSDALPTPFQSLIYIFFTSPQQKLKNFSLYFSLATENGEVESESGLLCVAANYAHTATWMFEIPFPYILHLQ